MKISNEINIHSFSTCVSIRKITLLCTSREKNKQIKATYLSTAFHTVLIKAIKVH